MEQNLRVSFTRALFVIFFLSLTWYLNSSAVCLKPEVAEKLRKEGKLEEWVTRWQSAANRGMYETTPDQLVRLAKRNVGDVDTLRPFVLCVDFSDNVHTRDTSEFSTLLFSKNFTSPTGSFRDYYLENSYGQHDPNGGVYGWVTAPQTYDYYTWEQNGLYGPYPHNARGLVHDALLAANPYVDFQEYDYDNDGWIDGLIVIHAGPGAEETGDDWDIWSHTWTLVSEMNLDGVRILDYTIQPEVHANGALIDIGVFCHEWGHFLGIGWEEYDTDYSSWGLGDWSVMATGCYNNGGKTPAHHSAYCKYFLGWAQIDTVQSNRTGVEIIQAETSPVAYRLWTSGQVENQFFMVENRQKTRFDSYLPGSGLLIYHVDRIMSTNNNEWCPGDPALPHFKTALKQADGEFELEGCYGDTNQGDWGDPFPGSQNKRAFDDTTFPDSRNYHPDSITQVAVWSISDPDSVMYANLDVTWSRPNLALEDFFFDDSAGGDGDGRPEPEETVELYFVISHISWATLLDAWVIASVDTEGIIFSVDSVNLGDIDSGETVNNYEDPIEFTVASGFPPQKVDFTLHVCGNGGANCTDLAREETVGSPEILLVDDDQGSSLEDYYIQSLQQLGPLYDLWDKTSRSDRSFNLSDYEVVIWFTGDHRDSIFSSEDVESLMVFLDNGGRLFLTSQDAVEVLSSSSDSWDTLFLRNYLHVGYNGNNTKHLVAGHLGGGVEDSLWIYPEKAPGAQNQTSKDNLVPDSEADEVLAYADGEWILTDLVAGTKFENEVFKVVVFGFGFEAINSSGEQFHGKWLTKPETVMGGVLNWLRVSSHVGIVMLDSTNYSGTDDRLLATVIDPDLDLSATEADTVSIRIISTTDKTGISIICTETSVNSGAFSGSCGFTTEPSDDLNDLISVSDSDMVAAVYTDQNPFGERKDEAIWTEKVDLEPPTFTVGILQNPIFSAELNIYTIASESLKAAPTVTIGTDTLGVEEIYHEGKTIYTSTYKLDASGTIQIKVVGTDWADNEGVHTEIFATGSVLPSGGNVISHDDVLRLEVGPGAVDQQEYFLVFIADSQGQRSHGLESYPGSQYYTGPNVFWGKTEEDIMSATYLITPSRLKLKSKAKLSFSYAGVDLEGEDPVRLVIHRLDGDAWTAIPSYLDTEKLQVVAFINDLGIYQLRSANAQEPRTAPTAYVLKNNYPNPFNSSTNIKFETSSPGWVKIEIYNLLGQRVKILVDDCRPAGRYTTDWRGINDRDEGVSSGIYFYTMKIGGFVQTKPMIFLK